MAKVALLIGVSDYEVGLNPLPGTAKDVEAMQQVLQHPEIGDFAEVKTLPNPERQAMEEAIETLFASRQKDDLVLLFFSGHGIKDESGKLYLATRTTRKNPQGELVKATAVPASFVQEIMSNSRCKRQVVILDCCFSGAFAEGWLAKDDDSVDVKNQLGGEGRVVLTSSTSTQYSFEQQESDLSTYTRYLVEGIETGAADLDSDGAVSVDELHDYAKSKVQEAAPAMRPEIYAVKEGYKIHLAQAPIGDPKLRYRKEVERFASRGEISAIGRYTLNALRTSLGVLSQDADPIELEVLKPYQEYKQKLQQYEQVLVEAIQREQPLSMSTRYELKHFQQVLGLRNEDIASIEERIAAHKEAVLSSNQVAEMIQTPITSRSEKILSVKSSDEAITANQAETPEPTKTRLSGMLSASIPVIRNPKLLFGVGIATAVTLTSYFLVQPILTNSPTLTTIPTVSPTAPMSAKDFYNRGLDKSNKGDYKGAIEDYNQALLLNPNYVLVYSQRGYALNRLEEYEAAIEDFNKYIQTNPKDGNVYLNRGNAYYQQGNYEQAISDYNKAIEINPKDAVAYYNRGNVYRKQGNYEQAISDYNKAIEINPKYALAYHNRGYAYYEQGNYEQAISDYNKAIEINPKYALAYNNRGNAYYEQGNYEQAISNYNKAIEINPKYADAYYNRGNVYGRQGNYEKAISDRTQALSIDPNYANAYYSRGIDRSNLGDKQGAIADYKKAADLYQKQGKTENYKNAINSINALQQ